MSDPTLSDEELGRYARHIVLPQIGGVGQRRLKASRVAVIGAGGIGSAVIPALAGAGIGQLTIIDDDVVDVSNLHRQTIFTEADAGAGKADRAAAFVRALNPFVDVATVASRLDGENARAMFEGHDIVVDGSDNFATRLAVSDACTASGIPLISAAAIQFQGQVGLFRSAPCYRCFVGDAFDPEDCDTCAEAGVVGALSGTMGNFAALLTINAIVGIGPVESGVLHIFHGQRMAWRSMRIPPDPMCRACGAKRD